MKKLSTNEIIKKCVEVHGDKYDYSCLVYNGYKEKINIICPIHGVFLQRCDKHLSGHGCPKCRKGNRKKHNETKRGMTFEEFTTQAKILYNDLYEYDQKTFINVSTKMKIFCKKCNEWFEQIPKEHLRGCGCKKCGLKKLSLKNRSNFIEFIEKAKKIHGNKYDYSKVVYVNAKTKVCIICPKHGEFWQKPNTHLNNCGCPKCRQSHMEEKCELFLKNNNIKYITQHTFEWLKFKTNLYLDFYLPEYNIAIECQGEQHFNTYRWEDNDIKLKLRQLRDKNKRELCEKHNISIYYINYNENIENKINNILKYVLD